MNKERLGLQDTIMSAIIKMSDGNPGAVAALSQIVGAVPTIDPQSAHPMLTIMTLDSYGIYGSSIYVLFSDKCGSDIRRMLMLLRATQLGFFSHKKLKEMAEDQSKSINLTEEEFKDLDDKVCAELKHFQKAA